MIHAAGHPSIPTTTATMDDMDDDNDRPNSFAQVLHGIQNASNPNDPRALRLTAVSLAVVEIIQQEDQQDVTAARVFAKAVTALEGTLLSDEQNMADVRSNQLALLELWHVTVPYVEPAALVAASLPVTSRILRALIVEVSAASSSVLDEDNHTSNNALVLRGTCQAAAALLQKLPTTTDERLTQQLLVGTLLTVWNDRRPKVRQTAHNELWHLLRMDGRTEPAQQIHPCIAKTTSLMLHNALLKAARAKTNNNDQWQTLLLVLPLVERAIWNLNYPQLATDIMEFLTVLLLQQQSQFVATASAEHFVAVRTGSQQSIPRLSTMNALWSIVLVLLDAREEHCDIQHRTWSNEFAPRVLASLLQIQQPHLLFLESNHTDVAQHTQTLLGQVVLASCQHLLMDNDNNSDKTNLAGKLLPLSVQFVLQLSLHPSSLYYHPTSSSTTTVAETLWVELTQLFRTALPPWMARTTTTLRNQSLMETVRATRRVLDDDHKSSWSVSLPSLVVLWQQVHSVGEAQAADDKGNHDDDIAVLIADCVEQLIDLHHGCKAKDDAQAIEGALAALIQAVGLEQCWQWIVWQSPAATKAKDAIPGATNGIAKERAWILSTLKVAASTAVQPVAPRLHFFQNDVLGMARVCDKQAAAVSGVSSKLYHRQLVVDLWSLFPCFCRSPSDLAEALPSLTTTLGRALEDKRYPELLTAICQGFTTLVQGLEANGSLELDTGSEDMAAVASAAVKLLPVLFKFVSDAHAAVSAAKEKDAAKVGMDVEDEHNKKRDFSNDSLADYQKLQSVMSAISALARHAPAEFLHGLFKKLMHRLLEEVQAENGSDSERICSLLTLSQALVASRVLDESSIVFLYRALKPLIRNDEHGSRAQKRAYKVLAEICDQHPDFVTEPERLKELSELLTGTIMTSQISARPMRLKCMKLIVDVLDETNMQLLKEIHKATAEVLLCLKDSNGKSREAAYHILISLASKGDVMEFLQVIIAALGAKTPHMRSAVVMALSRIVFEKAWDSEQLQSLLPSLLQTVLVLIDEGSREVVKSIVGFIRICVSAIPPVKLEPLLPELMGAMLKSNQTKSRFRAKIKIILKKLVKHFGYDALMPHVPGSETRLLTHMRKLDEREKRRKRARNDEGMSRANNFDEMVDSDEDDSDDGRTLMTGFTGFSRLSRGKVQASAGNSVASKRSKRTAGGSVVSGKSKAAMEPKVRLPDETDGEVLDMLGAKMSKRVHFMDNDNDDSGSDDEMMEFNDDGKLIVHDDKSHDKEDDDIEASLGSGKRRRISKLDAAKVARNEKSSKKQGQQTARGPGSAYKSKKAGGDVKKKGQKYEPYAFVPLDGRAYSKKNRKNAVEQMSSVVRKGKRKR